MSLISHRGAKGLAPENTVASIKVAAKLGVPYIEFDVQHTSDNHLVLFHNNTTASGKKITETTFSEIRAEHTDIAELEEALAACGNATPLVEIKTLTTAKLALKTLKKYPGCAVTSFVTEEIELLKKELPSSQLFIMQHTQPFGIIKKAKQIGATGIGINKNWAILLPHYYWHAQRNGLDVYTYTINTRFVAALFLRIMPNLFICTDRPDLLQKLTQSFRIVDLLGLLLVFSILFEIALIGFRRFIA